MKTDAESSLEVLLELQPLLEENSDYSEAGLETYKTFIKERS